MLESIGVAVFGILIFLFLFWKRLKEDYAAEIIFKSATYILAGIGIGYAIASGFFPAWFFWTAATGGLVGLAFAILRFRVRFYETLEAFILSSLPWLALVFLQDSVAKSSLSSFLAFLVILIMVFVAYYFDTHYKRFSWYKSGKIGFAGLATAILIFLIRSAIAIVKVPMLSFAGSGETALSGVTVLICFLLFLNLGKVKK